MQIGILEHPTHGFLINSDGDLQRYTDGLRKYPVRVSLQPVYPDGQEHSRNQFSTNLSTS